MEAPPTGVWPEADQEVLGACPICGEAARTLLHARLWDNIFFVAPGWWQMWRCDRCRSGYLDPRPDRESIGRAYERYYTHHSEAAFQPSAPANALQRLRMALGNGYRNRRYGTEQRPASALGPLVGTMLPPTRWPVDAGFRYLPRRRASERPKVLDIGCGAGEWLLAARSAGWEAVGADPDPEAVEQARQIGLAVRAGSTEAWADQAGTFEAVTMNHVIEHVHDPNQALEEVFDLLRPGGQLFIETPNVDALTHAAYGENWRGLEPPRHLILFTRKSLADALRQSGFEQVRFRWRPSPTRWLSVASERMSKGADPYDDAVEAGASRVRRRGDWWRASRSEQAEFITLTCRKPR